MMDGGEFVPVLVGAGVLGAGWCWRAAAHRALRRHARCEAAARAAGWDYEPAECGFALAGRTLTCDWVLHSAAHGGARATVFSLGAPDERRAMLALGTGAAPGVLRHAQPWPPDDSLLHRHVWIEADAPEDARRVLDARVARLLADWIAPHRADGGRGLHAWLSPHGVQIASAYAPRDWPEIEPLVHLGISLGHCAGLA